MRCASPASAARCRATDWLQNGSYEPMFSSTISDHIMIAHSIRGAVFGPAQQLHGNTLVIEVEFQAPALDQLNMLVDFALARTELRRILDAFDCKNLDEHPGVAGQNT